MVWNFVWREYDDSRATISDDEGSVKDFFEVNCFFSTL